MTHVKFFEAYDNRFNTNVIVGYEIEYAENIDGVTPKYHHMPEHSQGNEVTEHSFYF